MDHRNVKLMFSVLVTLCLLSIQILVVRYAIQANSVPKQSTLYDNKIDIQNLRLSNLKHRDSNSTVLPVVLMHGMGDAAGHSGMIHIRQIIAKALNTEVINIQLGKSVAEDVSNSFFVNMDNQVDMFAEQIKSNPTLAKGFNAAGFSQGNLLIRAYIERYNDPPVSTFISFHGPLAGVGALPQCSPTDFVCRAIDKLIGDAVYSPMVQERLAQSNYYRDPLKISQYLQNARFLPDLNNERPGMINATYKANFVKLEKLVLVKAMSDTQVFPKESEWFGAYEDNLNYKRILGFNETKWYKEDLFGLQTLDRAGKIDFLTTDGNHLQFTIKFLLKVVQQYFKA